MKTVHDLSHECSMVIIECEWDDMVNGGSAIILDLSLFVIVILLE
jgi:hypothetical protein